ncbi:MAG TPA: hypothetical protein VEN81_02035, partial [Planctomycetota bacterium]|nr:hypothetical protein [Planctomycetota bacterium]
MRFVVLWGVLGAVSQAAEARIQESPEQALFRKCDSQIPWISDGTVLVDGTPKSSADPAVDREALLGRALAQARERQRLVLWYCMRVPGTHTYRAAVLDGYSRVALFTDPGLVDLVVSKFVPLRMAADDRVGAPLGVRFPQFVEPGLVVLSPEGRVVHVLDRIRTFDADWVRALLIAVLRKNDAYNAPLGDTAELLIRGGDDERALPKATAEEKALIYRRAGNYEEVLKLPCGPVEKGIARLGRGELEPARALLEREASPMAQYYLSAIEWKLGKDPEKIWRRLVQEHPESPWAWQAASNLVRGPDGTRQGPLTHLFQSFCPAPPQGLPPATRAPAAD